MSNYLRAVLPDPHERPARIFILSKLPLTSVGKLSRIELRRQAADAALHAELDRLGDDLEFRIDADAEGKLGVRVLSKDKQDQIRPIIELLGLRLFYETI